MGWNLLPYRQSQNQNCTPIVRHTLPIGDAVFSIEEKQEAVKSIVRLDNKIQYEGVEAYLNQFTLPLNSMKEPTKHDQYTSDTLPAAGCDWLLETFYIGFEGVF